MVPNSAVEIRNGRRPAVLVVDDDVSIRRMMIAALKRSNEYEFLEAGNGREALDIMRRDRPAAVVLDLMMPVMSGFDVLQERSTDPVLRNIPVIVVSANRAPEIATAVDKGICAFLPKPFDINVLNALVKSCLVPRPKNGSEDRPEVN
jgi:two-component system response regulator (stage 0 sporulation protein F)